MSIQGRSNLLSNWLWYGQFSRPNDAVPSPRDRVKLCDRSFLRRDRRSAISRVRHRSRNARLDSVGYRWRRWGSKGKLISINAPLSRTEQPLASGRDHQKF